MEEFTVLALALLSAGAVIVAGILWYETAGKVRRRRRIEREHARSKLR